MVIAQRMDAATYERIAGDAAYKLTELHDGIPVEKPVMSETHGDLMVELAFLLRSRLDPSAHRLRVNHAKLAVPGGAYYIPNIAVLPMARSEAGSVRGDLYHHPASLVVEIWSPSTGDYYQQAKIPGYMLRGDREIWLVHPYERTLTRWLREDDGEYRESVLAGGTVSPAELPDVAIDLDALLR